MCSALARKLLAPGRGGVSASLAWATLFLAVACGGSSDAPALPSSGGSGGSGGSPPEPGAGGSSGGSGGNAGGSSSVPTAGTAGAIGNGAATRLALGTQYGCVLDTTGAIVCWGTPAQDVGQTKSPAGAFVSLSAAPLGEVTCAVNNSAQPVCWGNVTGAAADPVLTTVDAIAIDVGISEQCVVNRAGSIACWGVGLPQAPAGPFQQVGVGKGFACALRSDGSLACWGTASKSINSPAGTYVELQTGGEHSCARTQDGSVTCWGLGDTTDTNDGTNGAWGQAIAPTGVKFKSIALGQTTSCGILETGDVQCWGAGKTAGDCMTPETCGQALAQSGPFVEIAVGYTNACGILATGKVKCWARLAHVYEDLADVDAGALRANGEPRS